MRTGAGIERAHATEERHIKGVVVDSEGKPVAGASIDHSNDNKRAHVTGPSGRFELDTNAPLLVVRKAGYRSGVVRTKDATEVRIVLQTAERRSFPMCSTSAKCYGIDGWDASFRFPVVPGVEASKQGHDIDYGFRSYYVRTGQESKGIQHGSGPMWSLGIPVDQHVWRSNSSYEEVVFDADGLTIIDARGQSRDGKRWRSLSKFGETASYFDADEATAKILDQLLDGACLSSPAPR